MWFNKLESRRLRGDQIEVFKILNGYENIDRNKFSRSRNREGLEDMELVTLAKKQCRLDIIYFFFSESSQRVLQVIR